MTGLDVITNAMRKFNGIEPGEDPTSDEAADGLEDLNDMLDAWQTEKLMTYTVLRQVFPLTVLQQAYTLGPGGNFNAPRPVRIDRMSIVNLQNPSQPMELPIAYYTEAQWQQVPVKNISSSLPSAVWDDEGFPLRTLNYWCIPSVPVQTVIYSWALFSSFADLVTDYEFPPGYGDAIKWNLAYRLAGQYGPYMPPTLPAMAVESKARVKSVNISPIDLRCDSALVGSGKRQYNWITDSPVGSR